MTHVEVLKGMRAIQEMDERALLKSGITKNAPIYQAHAEKTAALTAAIAALDAVGKADEAVVYDDNEIRHTDDCIPKHYGRVLIIPADAVGGAA